MSITTMFLKEWRLYLVTLTSVIVSLIVFRLFLLPNTVPATLDPWRDVQAFRFGLQDLSVAASLVCLATAVVWFSYYPIVAKDENRFGLWLVTGAWLSMPLITILTSLNQAQLVGRQANILLGYLSGLIVARLFRRLDTHATALIFCGTLQSVLAVIYHQRGINVFMSGDVPRASGTFTSPSDLYLIAVFILPFAVQRIFASKNQVVSAFYMLSSATMTAALILTWARTGLLAVCIGVVWLMRSYLDRRSQIVSLLVASMVVCGVFFQRSNGTVNQASARGSIESRSFLVREGLATFAHHPLTGVGIGRLTLPVPVTVNRRTTNFQMIQPYNQVLFWLDEMGVLGGIIVIFFALFIQRSVSKSSSQLMPGVGATWVCVLIASLFNTLFGCYDLSCANMLIGSLIGMTMRLPSQLPPDTDQ